MEQCAGGLTGNQLKILALVAMTCDHVGKQLLPDWTWLQILGRLAFPIFAYMIAEGCRHTRHKARYLGTMAALALACQVIYYMAMGSLYQCVLVSFSLTIGLIFLLQRAQKNGNAGAWLLVVLALAAICGICLVLPRKLPGFAIDYGLWGVMLPVAVYLGRSRWEGLLLFGLVLLVGCLDLGGIQWWSLLTLPLLALYRGRRGKWRLKYLFYIYYPLHLGVIYLISLL